MRLQLILLINLFLLGVFCDQDEMRKLNVTKNPDCPADIKCDELMVLHIKADGDNDCLHYIYDFTGKPSVLIAKAELNSSLQIDWTNFLNQATDGSVKIIPEPSYSFTTVIDNLVIFNDTKDSANYSDSSVIDAIKIDSLNLNWKQVGKIDSFVENVTLEMKGEAQNGSFSIKYTTYSLPAHGIELPHLFHTANSMQIDVVAENINSSFKSPRIAIELLLVSFENKDEGGYKINRIRNLDDEYTPGIFDVYNLVSPRADNDTRGSFLQYRPVCYMLPSRTVSSSTESKHGNPMHIENPLSRFKYTLPLAYYGFKLHSKLNQALNITFGMTGDGFYSRTNYISFSYLMGVGYPPLEGLSPFVITFIVLGLGIPLLVLIVGGTYVAVKRYRN